MSSPPTYDHDLLNRLNRLKQSSISSLDTRPILDKHDSSPEDRLSTRLKSLRNNVQVQSLPQSLNRSERIPPEYNITAEAAERGGGQLPVGNLAKGSLNYLDELEYNSVRPRNDWSSLENEFAVPEGVDEPPSHDEGEADHLSHQARAAIQQAQDVLKRTNADGTSKKQPERPGPPFPREATNPLKLTAGSTVVRLTENAEDAHHGNGNGSQSDDIDSDEAEDAHELDNILAELLDQIEFEKADQGLGATFRKDESLANRTLNLPGVPSDTTKSETFEEEIASRMAALHFEGDIISLDLPSVPAKHPREKAVAPTRRADPTVIWCAICMDNATVLCHGPGCDEQLYCMRCWKEMHLGRDVGWEQRAHEWERFTAKT